MCKCNPSIKTPYCGKGDCIWPGSKPEGSREDSKDSITISIKEYERLIERDNFLLCLESCGVDNWGGYGDAQEMMEANND